MSVTVDRGPSQPFSSGSGCGLFHDRPCLKWELDDSEQVDRIELSLPVATAHVLRIALFGAYCDGEPEPYRNIEIGLRLIMDDGPAQGLVDQHGHPLPPGATANCLVVDQWNVLDIDLDAFAGRELVALELTTNSSRSATGWIQVAGLRPRKPLAPSPVEWVDTRRGTHSSGLFSRGNNIPATAVPNGFNFLAPVTNARTSQWIYEWHTPRAPRLQALAFTHEPSPWIRDRGQLQVMPWSGRPDPTPEGRSLGFNHDHEVAQPHRYRVELEGGITAGVVPTSRTGAFTFDYSTQDAHGVVIDVPRGGGISARALPDGRLAIRGWIEGDPDTSAPDAPREETRRSPRGFFHGETLQAARVVDDFVSDGTPQLAIGTDATHLELRIALSWISTEQARHNLELEAPPTVSRDDLERAAADSWNDLLGRASTQGALPDQLTTLYSNLYRLFLYPNEHSENVGTADNPDWRFASPYRPVDAPHTAECSGNVVSRGELLVNNGYWDTYRTCWPAYQLLTPDRAPWLNRGILQQFVDGGWMARWSGPGYIDCMVGTSSDTVFADAATRGMLGEDELTAFDSAVKNASTPSPDPKAGRKSIETSRFVGYTDSSIRSGLSWSLETTICDAAVGTWAASLADRCVGHPRRTEFAAWAAYLCNRSKAYELLHDPATGFFRGRRPDGSWSHEPFNPLEWGNDYVETHAWGMLLTPVHDGAGVSALLGGRDRLLELLDELHATPEVASDELKGDHPAVSHEMREARATRQGLLALTNQPAHHIPFMYAHTDAPWRVGEVTRDALDRLFVGSEIGQGYPGDEDNGEMSAWWLFAALGFYPLMPASGEYVLTAPLFERFEWRLPEDRRILVTAEGARHRRIQRVELDGEPWPHVTVPADRLANGCHLHFILGEEQTNWAPGSHPWSLVTEGGCYRPDRASTETLSSPVADVPSLTDDQGRTEQHFAPGDWLEFTCDAPVNLVTLTGTGPLRWHLEGSADPSEHGAIALPNQLVPFLVPATDRGRIVFDAPAVLTQVELI